MTRATLARRELTPELLELLAHHFRALAEPARLEILSILRNGEATVSELIAQSDLGQANVSKHLQLLHSLRFVKRRKDGLYVYYTLADAQVFRLCDIVCGQIESETQTRRKVFAARPSRGHRTDR